MSDLAGPSTGAVPPRPTLNCSRCNDRRDPHPPKTGLGSTWSVLRRGWRTSPELREGAGITVLLALLGAAGRVTVPILVQLTLDHGLEAGPGSPTMWTLTATGLAVVVMTAVAARLTRIRLARAGERALCGLRVRAFRHIHSLSLATQTDERRGTLVSRVTSDVETLSQFLSWGGVAWLVNGGM